MEKLNEGSGVLERREDGWHVMIELDDGRSFEVGEGPFATKDEADRELQAVIVAYGISEIKLN